MYSSCEMKKFFAVTAGFDNRYIGSIGVQSAHAAAICHRVKLTLALTFCTYDHDHDHQVQLAHDNWHTGARTTEWRPEIETATIRYFSFFLLVCSRFRKACSLFY